MAWSNISQERTEILSSRQTDTPEGREQAVPAAAVAVAEAEAAGEAKAEGAPEKEVDAVEPGVLTLDEAVLDATLPASTFAGMANEVVVESELRCPALPVTAGDDRRLPNEGSRPAARGELVPRAPAEGRERPA